MSDTLTQDPAVKTALSPATVDTRQTVIHPAQAWPTNLERRRPGRNNDASPELIALMRKPTTEARLRVMLYDAPNFILPDPATIRGRSHPHQTIRMVAAVAGCSLIWAVAFRAMMMLWG